MWQIFLLMGGLLIVVCLIGLIGRRFALDKQSKITQKGDLPYELQALFTQAEKAFYQVLIRPGLNRTGEHRPKFRRNNFITILRTISFVRD